MVKSAPVFFQPAPQDGVIPSTAFSDHLPYSLYESLNHVGLLDGKDHEFIYRHTPGKSVNVTISVEAISFGDSKYIESVAIHLNFQHASNDASNTKTIVFENKCWQMDSLILNNGNDYVSGSKKYCPIDGFTDRQCRKHTPNVVTELNHTLSKIIGPSYVTYLEPEQKRSSCSIL